VATSETALYANVILRKGAIEQNDLPDLAANIDGQL